MADFLALFFNVDFSEVSAQKKVNIFAELLNKIFAFVEEKIK